MVDYDPTKENLTCLICGKRIENWMTNSWQIEGPYGTDHSSNIAQMMYHAECWKNRHQLGGVHVEKAVARAYELLNPRYIKKVCKKCGLIEEITCEEADKDVH